MARVKKEASLDELVRSAVAPIAARLSAVIAQQIANITAEEIEAAVARTSARRPRKAASAARARPRPAELTRWVADRRARRVPSFVIEATGLDTKKKIVAKYGENAAFEKGKPLPADAVTAAADSKAPPKAKGPIVRKKAKAAAA